MLRINMRNNITTNNNNLCYYSNDKITSNFS